jgi:hypothetical protein
LLSLSNNGRQYTIIPLKNSGVLAIILAKDNNQGAGSTLAKNANYKIIFANGNRTLQSIAVDIPLLKLLRVYLPEEMG